MDIYSIELGETKLFIKGTIPDLSSSIAIVGTRLSTAKGKALAYHFSYTLAKQGMVIISGLARGIDTIAHKAAISTNGKTLAVLGSGVDVIYPPENKFLAAEITRHGALVSPYPNGTLPDKENFKPRNGVVVGLSSAVLVIEGQARSGTINTAHWAADLGKEVFACPGSPATDYLIANGAISTTSPEEILKYFDLLS